MGNVVVSCPAVGAACVVTVAADGTASYARDRRRAHRGDGCVRVVGACPRVTALRRARSGSCPALRASSATSLFRVLAGGAACVATVAADGTASYERTGGVPTVAIAAYGSWNLPPGHGLSAGEIRG